MYEEYLDIFELYINEGFNEKVKQKYNDLQEIFQRLLPTLEKILTIQNVDPNKRPEDRIVDQLTRLSEIIDQRVLDDIYNIIYLYERLHNRYLGQAYSMYSKYSKEEVNNIFRKIQFDLVGILSYDNGGLSDIDKFYANIPSQVSPFIKAFLAPSINNRSGDRSSENLKQAFYENNEIQDRLIEFAEKLITAYLDSKIAEIEYGKITTSVISLRLRDDFFVIRPKLWLKFMNAIRDKEYEYLTEYNKTAQFDQSFKQAKLRNEISNDDNLQTYLFKSAFESYYNKILDSNPELLVETKGLVGESDIETSISTALIQAIAVTIADNKIVGDAQALQKTNQIRNSLETVIGMTSEERMLAVISIIARISAHPNGSLVPLSDVLHPIVYSNENYQPVLSRIVEYFHQIFIKLQNEGVIPYRYLTGLQLFYKSDTFYEALQQLDEKFKNVTQSRKL